MAALSFSTPLSLLLLLHVLLHCLLSSSLSPAELSSLLDIRRSLHDLPGSAFFSTWDFSSNDPCTSFAGVICDEYNAVSALTLGTGLADSPGLAGTLPSSIADLAALTQLVINPGRILGTIPLSVGYQCRRLRLVSITNNLISGQIPVSLVGLPELHTLDLSHNRLSGTVPPPLLPSLPSLKVLILAANSLSGPIPPSVSSTRLLHLDLAKNALTGPLPPLPSTLRFLSATANSLSGSLDAAFSPLLLQLSFLDISMNQFSGRIPPAVFGSPMLSTIFLHRNNLSGPLILDATPRSAPPPWSVVDLSHNVIGGTLPPGLAAAKSLFLNSNKLTGPVPEEYAKVVYNRNITTFYAQHNFLTGFPLLQAPVPESVSLCLSYNCMVLPMSTEAGCPANAGTQQSRPAEQCPNGD